MSARENGWEWGGKGFFRSRLSNQLLVVWARSTSGPTHQLAGENALTIAPLQNFDYQLFREDRERSVVRSFDWLAAWNGGGNHRFWRAKCDRVAKGVEGYNGHGCHFARVGIWARLQDAEG
jgi:hypothetical protein